MVPQLESPPVSNVPPPWEGGGKGVLFLASPEGVCALVAEDRVSPSCHRNHSMIIRGEEGKVLQK